MGSLAGKVAVVTGGGKGIGRAVCERFAREGATVVVATRSAPPGEEVVASITEAGGQAVLEALDIGDRSAVQSMIARTAQRFGGIDIVVHNAAPTGGAPLSAMTDDELNDMLDVGLKAAFWLTKDALPWLEKSPHGRILVTSSIAGTSTSIPGRVHYGAAKAGMTGFIKGAALELARSGITVNGVAPGLVLTPALTSFASAEQIAQVAAHSVPLGRPGQPEEIAHAFVFFASDESDFITGQLLTVDGGSTLGDATSAVGVQ
jgi:3-oxoacyl-[acyl-carrier protein] reductase